MLTDAPRELDDRGRWKRSAFRSTWSASVGTGYGRATLPFPKEQIRSEILCHGLGAHAMFPDTRTVLDIGGQDTKAIQVDERGIVTSFQMNDRCAAGCGRYLGYIADEMNLGLHELGPMACQSTRPVRINSTCTVFAGAELRERLSLGREARGHPRRPAPRHHPARHVAARPLGRRQRRVHLHRRRGAQPRRGAVRCGTLIDENYGELTMNISPDSIYTGALGRGAVRPARPAAGAAGGDRRSEGGGMSTRANLMRVAGIDVGSSAVKIVVMEDRGRDRARACWRKGVERIRRRDPNWSSPRTCSRQCVEEAGVPTRATRLHGHHRRGRDPSPFRTGHFYGMTTHARGGLFLDPEARAVLDIGALHTRGVLLDERAKVLSYRMTSQCASGSGQFLENISRYLGITLDEIGPLSLQADNPEACSSICAVLAETDVINMVSRGITTSNIIKGIHQSMAGRYLRLLDLGGRGRRDAHHRRARRRRGPRPALREARGRAEEDALDIRAHPDSVYAGAIGAALWGAFRARKLAARGISLGNAA